VSVAAVRERLQTDTPFWAGGVTRDPETGLWLRPGPDDFQGCAKVVNKARRLVPLVGHPWQLEFDAKLEEQRAAGRPMRAIILKARQLGFSTWVQAKICQRLTMFMYQQATVVAQDVDTAGKLFNMTTTMHAHLPSEAELGLGFNIKPQITGSSFSPNGRKFVSFGEASRKLREAGRGGESVLDIDTAQSAEAGSGGTRNLVHLSEVAKWPDFATQGTKSKMVSMLNSVPFEPETLVVLESTAYGLNHFYRRWISAVAGDADELTGESYIPIFVPWWRDPAYTVAFPTEGHRERFVESIGAVDEYSPDDEVMLAEALELSAEQLLWRRMQIRTQHEGNVRAVQAGEPGDARGGVHRVGQPGLPGDPRAEGDPCGGEGAGAGAGHDPRGRAPDQAHARRDDRGPDEGDLGAGRSGAARRAAAARVGAPGARGRAGAAGSERGARDGRDLAERASGR
jgi:hypothetical protein